MLIFKDVVLAWLALAITAVSGRLHLATKGLLQIHPSFVGDGITLFPGHHPDHDIDHFDHLVPQLEQRLYYAQEGHRPAVHGAKHGALHAKFVRPTIVLDHTSHLKRVHCGVPNQMELCFSEEDAFRHAQKAWNMSEFNIVTFHIGCGDEYSGQRSYFHAKRPTKIDLRTRCIVIPTKQIEHTEALDSGEVTWGVYRDPKLNKRTPVLGHVKLTDEPGERARAKRDNPDGPGDSDPDAGSDDNGGENPDETNPEDQSAENGSSDTGDNGGNDGGDGDTQYYFPGDEPPTEDEMQKFLDSLQDPPEEIYYDLQENLTEAEYFFGEAAGYQPEPVPDDEDLSFLGDDYSLPPEDLSGTEDSGNDDPGNNDGKSDNGAAPARRHSSSRASSSHKYLVNSVESRDVSTYVEKRINIFGFLVDFINHIVKLIRTFADIAKVIAKVLIEVAIISAKLVAAAFGAPFDHSFHNDFKFEYKANGTTSNKPPKLFGRQPGVELAGSGALYNVQCVKCGISGDFSIDGALAFSIKDGITKGTLQLKNANPFNLDAQIGMKVTLQADKAEATPFLKKDLGKLPLSPLSIPGVIILGPFVSIAAELDMTLTGEAELLVGGSLTISPGTATLDAKNETRNGIKGLEAKFTPVAQFNGSLTASLALGLPVSIEVGLDLLNGKFKKSIGLVEKPLVYVSASAATGNKRACKGVEIRIGAKNQIYLSVLDYYKYPITDHTIYEKGLGCITEKGFDPKKVEPDSSVFKSVVPPGKPDNVNNSTPNLKDVSKELKAPVSKAGYRIIMDKDQSHILVAGKDGRVYLASSDERYDLTAPWGTLDLESKAYSLDVTERFMAAHWFLASVAVAPIGLVKSKKVPEGLRVMGLKAIKDGDSERVALAIHSLPDRQGKIHLTLRYPTFCKTSKGTVLFSTRCIIGDDGIWKESDKSPCEHTKAHDLSLKAFDKTIGDPRKNCRTIQLSL